MSAVGAAALFELARGHTTGHPGQVSEHVRVARSVPVTAAEGPYLRYALWVQGCSLRCPGCCNPQMLPSDGGRKASANALVEEMRAAQRDLGIEGITVLGGEPLEQTRAVATIARGVRAHGLGVIVYTGFGLSRARAVPGFAGLWAALDTLVDGRYDRDAPEPADGRCFVGSSNQRIWHRTRRYADPDLWRGPAIAEVRIGIDGATSVHGEPHEVAALAAAWRRPGP